MTNRTIFHFARHGQTQWNIEQRIQGQLDSALTIAGEQQALQLAALCEPLNISQILTSSLGRAVQTAKICAQYLHLSETVLPGIEERHFGTWQGRLTAEVQALPDYAEITSQVSDCKPLHGESSKQLLARVEKALKQQFRQSPEDNYLVVTHGDVMRCFMSQFQQEGYSMTGFDYKNAHLVSISYDHVSDQFLPC